MAKKGGTKTPKQVEALKHEEASRKNIPTAEYQSLMPKETAAPVEVRYERRGTGLDAEKAARNRDLDPQLVWRGKDEKDWSDLVVPAPPLFIQEKVHPKVLIDDLMRRSRKAAAEQVGHQVDLFADFNGIADPERKAEFYQHDANWTNRMILGDSLQVMASLAEREGLRGQVQCIYIDPPYGIKFNSNFQWSTTSRDVKDGETSHITREPEQVKAFRDTWRDGIHSYLTYLRDRLTLARDLLADSGAIFVQIGEENCHLARALLDEVFGSENLISQIAFAKTASATSEYLPGTYDLLLFYARRREALKFRQPLVLKELSGAGGSAYRRVQLPDLTTRTLTAEEVASPALLPEGARVFRIDNLTSQSVGRSKGEGAASWFPVRFAGRDFRPSEKVRWKTNQTGMRRLGSSNRLAATDAGLYYVRYFDDFRAFQEDNIWGDTGIAGFTSEKRYVVETSEKVVQRCILMVTDPGDLVLDPTCGSGTTAFVAELWGRRWITIDTSRVALALARARIMGARYPFFLLSDSREGQRKEAELTRTDPLTSPTRGDVRQGFVYERVPHVTLKSIASNSEIDVISDKFRPAIEALLLSLNETLGKSWEEWEVPREMDAKWPAKAKECHAKWRLQLISRQREIDASIAAKAESEYIYDSPYEDPRKVRVAGPLTVESLSPHRVLGVDENDELIDLAERRLGYGPKQDFQTMILENLKVAGVQQAHKEDRINFSSLVPWPGKYVCAEGKYLEGAQERRAGVFIGPEFGTVLRADLVDAARECADAGFDVLIACAFNYEVHATNFATLGRIPILKARMNADLHMAEDLKATGKGNLFVIFGEPDIEILDAPDDQIQIKVKGVDVFDPKTGEIRSDSADGIACWFIDTDYNEESFFVRHAYFLGANDPYKALKTTLKAEIDEEAWATLHSDTSRPFEKPSSGRIAVKVINHLGDEVMKVFRA